jgi:hypothetical protein
MNISAQGKYSSVLLIPIKNSGEKPVAMSKFDIKKASSVS